MNASEAKRLSEASRPDILFKICTLIEQNAKKGLLNARYDIKSVEYLWIGQTISKLKSEGYAVDRICGSDCRTSEGWDYLNISW